MNEASSRLLREQGYMSFVDVLIALGKLTHEEHARWRFPSDLLPRAGDYD